MSERDTHFQGSAKRLWQRLRAEIEYGPNNGNLAMQKAALEQIITRHDYDLAMHVIDALKPFIYTNTFTPDNLDEIFKSIPDLE